MTDREKKRAKDILCGKSTEMIVLLVMVAILLLVVLMFCAWLGAGDKLGFQDSVGVMLVALLIVGSIIVIFAIIIDLIVGYFVRCNILMREFEDLPGWKKEKLLVLAHKYGKSKQIHVEENYIYGVMAEQRHGRKRGRYTIAFRYIDLSEMVWAYKIEQYIAITGMNLGITTKSNVMPYEKTLRLYIRDGRYFQGKCSEKENQKLFEMLKEKNPSCKLGYKKEWKK